MVLSDKSIRVLLGKVVLLADPNAVQPASLALGSRACDRIPNPHAPRWHHLG